MYKTKNNIAIKSTFNVKNKIVVVVKIKTRNKIECIGFLLEITKIAQVVTNKVITINIKFGFDIILFINIRLFI
jgi:hypothetical protein